MVVCAYFPIINICVYITVRKAFQIHCDRVFFICVGNLISWIGRGTTSSYGVELLPCFAFTKVLPSLFLSLANYGVVSNGNMTRLACMQTSMSSFTHLQQLSDSATAHALLCHRMADWVLCSVGTENLLHFSFLWTVLIMKNTSHFTGFLKDIGFSSFWSTITYVGF